MVTQPAEYDEPRESHAAAPISRRALNDIEQSIHNLEHGLVGDEFELDELQDLLNEP
jgi:hypothetical protein